MSDYLSNIEGNKNLVPTEKTPAKNTQEMQNEESIFSSITYLKDGKNKDETNQIFKFCCSDYETEAAEENASSITPDSYEYNAKFRCKKEKYMREGEDEKVAEKHAKSDLKDERIKELTKNGYTEKEASDRLAKEEEYAKEGKSAQEIKNIFKFKDSGLDISVAEEVASLMEQGAEEYDAKFEVYKNKYIEDGSGTEEAEEKANEDIYNEKLRKLRNIGYSQQEALNVMRKEEYIKEGKSEQEARNIIDIHRSGVELEVAEEIAALMEEKGIERDDAKLEVYTKQRIEKGYKKDSANTGAETQIREERINELTKQGVSNKEAWNTAQKELYIREGKNEKEIENILETLDYIRMYGSNSYSLEDAENIVSLMEQGVDEYDAKFEVYKNKYLKNSETTEKEAQDSAKQDIFKERINELKDTEKISYDEAWIAAKKEELIKDGMSEEQAQQKAEEMKKEEDEMKSSYTPAPTLTPPLYPRH